MTALARPDQGVQARRILPLAKGASSTLKRFGQGRTPMSRREGRAFCGPLPPVCDPAASSAASLSAPQFLSQWRLPPRSRR